MEYEEKRTAILEAIASGAAYTAGKTIRVQHNPARWRGFYNAAFVSCNGLSQVVPLGMLNAAIQKGKRHST